MTPARLAAAGVFLAGALLSSLAWLVLCAEDAPNLIAAAPSRPGVPIRAKLAAALTPPLLMVSVPALVLLPMVLFAGLASSAIQLRTQPPARRSAFRKRYRSELLMAVGAFVMPGSLAGATRLLLAGVWCFRPKPAK